MARKILLADDSVTAQNMGRKILADAGYEVITVNNGSAALKKIAEIKPDLVILDVYMPGYSGLEVCQRLKESSDSSRIPVLLTVGKLEPFKPEEAQRVRAEGYIVKPFEASELLSALSKLEDKIVPRSEPSKPGRFARAIAAVEDSSHGRSSEFGEADENGWKSRIAFPHKKTETEEAEKAAEEKVVDDSSIYNQVNRDLRTVVATPKETTAEAVEEKKEVRKYNRRKEDREQAERAEKTSVDVAALASPGLPQDVTPEEVAAIAAAAAQIRSLQAIIQNEVVAETPVAEAQRAVPQAMQPQAVQPQAVQSQAVQSQAEERPVPASSLVEANLPELPVAAAPLPETHVAVAETVVAAETVLPIESVPVPVQAKKIPESSAETSASEAQDGSDAPVTIAVASAEVAAVGETSPSRWSAVSVALDDGEAAVSLEQEMQRAYTVFVAEETPAPELSAQTTVAEPISSLTPVKTTVISEAVAVVSTPAPEAIPVAASPSEAGSMVVPQSEVATALPKSRDDSAGAEAAPAVPVEINSQPALVQVAEVSSPKEVIPQRAEPIFEPVSEPAVMSVVIAEPEASLAPITEATPIEAAVATKAFTSFAPQAKLEEAPRRLEQEEDRPRVDRNEGDPESDALKTTAAAWANWRQIRDAGAPPPEEAQAHSREVEENVQRPIENIQEAPESAPQPVEPAAAAMAVAAGAEQAPQQLSPVAEAETPGDVASIVDSLLADLRPKLMAEISRKMSEKK